MLAEVDVRELPRKRLQWASTADWFTHLSGGFRRDGRRRVRHARALTSDYTETLEAVRSGGTSREQAGVLVEAVEALPRAVRGRSRWSRRLRSNHLETSQGVLRNGTPSWSSASHHLPRSRGPALRALARPPLPSPERTRTTGRVERERIRHRPRRE